NNRKEDDKLITQIKKRDGEIVNFDLNKIQDAIRKASEESEEEILNMEMVDVLRGVLFKLSDREDIITVECIQDAVEESLLEEGLVTTARAYMSYRERQRQARIPDIFKPRKAMKPYEYPQFMDYADAIRQSYWLHTEFNFTSDVQDFHTKVEPHERSAGQNSMLAVSQVEVDGKKFWGNLHNTFAKYEFSAVGSVFSDSETRHAEAYSPLLGILALNEMFEGIDDIPALKERTEYLAKSVSWAKTGDDKDYVLSLILFSLFIEHVSLFSQFLIMMSFNKHRNVFSGLSNVIEATSKEEQIHGLFGIDLVNEIRKEHPEWFDEEMEQRVIEACKQSYEAEERVVSWIFEDGELEFLPKKVVMAFIANRMNNSLESVGYDRLFDVDEELVMETSWFDDEVIGTKLTDFFDKRSINYSKFGISITADTLFPPLGALSSGKLTKASVGEA